MTHIQLKNIIQKGSKSWKEYEAIWTAVEQYIESQNSGKPLVSGSLPPNLDLETAKKFKKYYTMDDPTKFEQWAAAYWGAMVAKLEAFGGNDR